MLFWDRSLKNYQYSTEGQNFHENLAPVLVVISGNSLAFYRKIISSTGFYRYCAPDASAPVVVINESPIGRSLRSAGKLSESSPSVHYRLTSPQTLPNVFEEFLVWQLQRAGPDHGDAVQEGRRGQLGAAKLRVAIPPTGYRGLSGPLGLSVPGSAPERVPNIGGVRPIAITIPTGKDTCAFFCFRT